MKNVPNILSVLRAVLACVILALIVLIDPNKNQLLFIFCPGILFLIACITDTVDGQLARKKGLVSDFGKFIDPIADKILTFFAMLGFLYIDADRGLPVLFIAFAITLLREFSVSSLRMMAAKNGTVIAADWAGKLKTIMQMIAIVGYFFFTGTPLIWIAQILMGIATLLTVISGYLYIRNYLRSIKKA